MPKKGLAWLILLTVLVLLAAVALDQRLIVRSYRVESGKLEKVVRIAVLSDWHGCNDGEEILQTVAALSPDAILLAGDMFSADGNSSEELQVFRQLDEIAYTYYVTGNHETWEFEIPHLLEMIAATGVTVVEQTCVSLMIDGQRINICGVPDPCAGEDAEVALNRAADAIRHDAFTILMAHRPEEIGTYAPMDAFDLVVSGHAHGGQIRIPFLVNGLYAPNQGLLPQYAGGMYEVDGTVLIVSRGLSTQRQWGIPRIFNRPEVLLIELMPQI